MQRWSLGLAFATCWLAFDASAQQPGAFATSDEKLDYLLSTWRGQPVAHLRKVFGHEDKTEMRGTNPVFVYEKAREDSRRGRRIHRASERRRSLRRALLDQRDRGSLARRTPGRRRRLLERLARLQAVVARTSRARP